MQAREQLVLLVALASSACGGRSELEGSSPVASVAGQSSAGGTSAVASGGTTSTGGNQTTGCTGSFEEVQSGSSLCVAKMATITAPSGYADYSIDVTEVTQGQYDAWLATKPVLPASSDANCGYVTNYAEQGPSYMGTDADHHPVVYVDWCDAYEYCSGVGKRLCGAIGGGSDDYSTGFLDATNSQWYRACSSGGADTYPYGKTYQATYCDGYDYGANQTVAVGSLANCVTSGTGFAGAYDMSGNVWEWEDSCNDTGQSASCILRGGSFFSFSDSLNCGYDPGNYTRYYMSAYIGFRCCSL